MKKRTIITTEKREVWVIHHAPEPIVQELATPEEAENEQAKDPSPKRNGTFEKLDPEGGKN